VDREGFLRCETKRSVAAANGFDQPILSQSGKQTDVCALIS
jgi:hypothetical protein